MGDEQLPNKVIEGVNEGIHRILIKASNELYNAVYNERDDEDSLDLIGVGWQIGAAHECLCQVVEMLEAMDLDYQPNHEAYRNAEMLKEIRYSVKTGASELLEVKKGCKNDMGETDIPRLYWKLGQVSQMLSPTIVFLAPRGKTTDELIANAKKVEPLEQFSAE